MKVIDLLNKIANGEEVPKCFKVNNHTWEWNVNSYQNDLHSEFSVTGLRYDLSNLNDEIEIIEEDKKIEKLEHWVDVKSWAKGNDLEKGLEEQSEFNKNIYYKINEIIDVINRGD